ELVPAIQRALQASAPRVGTPAGPRPVHRPAAIHDHGVYFYDEAPALSRTAARFIADRPAADQAPLVGGTSADNVAIMEQLTTMDLVPEKQIAHGHLGVFDAATLLNRLLVDDMPSAALLEEELGPVIERVTRSHQRVVRGYGEMVDLLWNRNRQ